MSEWDAAGLLKLMWSAWNDVFRRTLGYAEHSLLSALASTFLGVSWSGGCPPRATYAAVAFTAAKASSQIWRVRSMSSSVWAMEM